MIRGWLQRLAHDLRTGIATLRYGTVRAAHRALEETELLQLRLEIRKLDARIQALYADIGERAVELYERGEPASQIAQDLQLARQVDEVSALNAERAKIQAEMDEVREPR